MKNQMKIIKKVVAPFMAIALLFGTTGFTAAKSPRDTVYTASGLTVDVGGSEKASWGFDKVGGQKAWGKGFTGKGVKIAILDTGVAPHSDLAVAGGVSMVDYTTSYVDDNGHGTHVAGILAAKRDGVGMAGIAPDAQIYAVKILNNLGQGNGLDLVEGLNWAIDNHMDIINVSLGTPTGSTLATQAVDRAIKAGIIVVTSSGNTGTSDGTGTNVSFPGTMDSVVTVGAVDENLTRGSFSSTGNSVDFVAPGVTIVSTSKTGGYESRSGTSMASPFIAGMFAILKEAFPTATSKELIDKLQASVQDLGASGRDTLYGDGFPSFERIAGIGFMPVDPTLLKDATSATDLAVKYKSKIYTDRAVDRVKVLPDSPEKTALASRLESVGVLLNPPAPQPIPVDAAALKKATDAVTLAEKYRAAIYVNRAKELILALPDGAEKTSLQQRMNVLRL